MVSCSFLSSTFVLLIISCVIALDKTPTKPKVTAVIRAVAKWRTIVELLETPDNLAKIAKMEAELDRLMEGLGFEVNQEKKTKKQKSAGPSKLSFLYFKSSTI